MNEAKHRAYANPDVLVSTEWVQANMLRPDICIVESNEDQLLYRSGHIEGAVEIDWVRDLNHPVRRDYLNGDEFSALMSRSGISRDTMVVFYGDKNNWWACYAFWVFQLFGHTNARIMDGGRLKWEKEARALTRTLSERETSEYQAPIRNDRTDRAFREEVLAHVRESRPLVDVRSPGEFSGERLHMEGYPNEGALRGGHIPGARSVPWGRAVSPEDGTFRPLSELKAIYEDEARLDRSKDIIAYCRIGERSSHTWFVLKYLLGYSAVRNYDGSWTEWGNLVNVPIER